MLCSSDGMGSWLRLTWGISAAAGGVDCEDANSQGDPYTQGSDVIRVLGRGVSGDH